MKRFVLTGEAEKDLDDIWFYIARESGDIAPAERVIWRLHQAIVTLADNPEIGRPCSEDIDPSGQWFPVDKYIVYYRPQAHRIIITHVFDGRRNQKKSWRKTKPLRKRAKNSIENR